MKIHHVNKEALSAVVMLLRPACPELDELKLVRALKAFTPEGVAPDAAPAVEPGSAITVREFADRLKVSKRHCWRLIKDGSIRTFKLSQRTIRIPETELIRLAEGGVR